MVNEISDKPKDSIHETAELIRRFIESSIDDVRAIGFYGSDMPLNSMKWFLVSQLLHLAVSAVFHAHANDDASRSNTKQYSEIKLREEK